ncbi:MAG: hypothetical protein WCG47_08605 [Dermatophilaceae bacterium]
MGASSGADDAVQERRQFAHAVCRSCGWVGPARRSRGKARRDRAEHDLDGHETTVATLDR